MAKPQQVQKLRKGRILTGKNFPAFADTFNYYGEFIENLKGDADIRPDSGSIEVDRTSPEHPVVRFVGDKAATVDSQLPDLHLSSAQSLWHDQQQYHELYNFQLSAISSFQLSDVNNDSYDLIVRDSKTDPSGKIVNYVKARDFLSATRYDVDTDATAGDQRSVEVVPHNQDHPRDYLQLYDFDNSIQNEFLNCQIAYGEVSYVVRPGQSTWSPDSQIQFVCRDYTEQGQDGQVVYDGIKVYAPRPNANEIDDLSSVVSAIVIDIDPGHECSCTISALSAAIDELSSELSDRWKVGGNYNDNCYGESIGDSGANPQIDLDNGLLLYSNDQDPTVDWHNCRLNWNSGDCRINWMNCEAFDASQGQAIDWDYRHLYDDAGNVAVRWSDRILHDSNQLGALDWEYRTLYDSNTHIVADWERQQLLDRNTIIAVNWADRHLVDSSQYATLNWQDRMLEGDWTVNGNLSVETGATLTIGNTTITEAQLQQLLSLLSAVPAQLSGV